MVLGSYVDDAFGGAQRSKVAQAFVDFISGEGARLGAVINAKKTEGPAASLVILGLLYDARAQVCALDPTKVTKYSDRIRLVIKKGEATSKELEKLVGNLGFAA